MSDVPKVHFPGGVNGGDALEVESGGAVNVNSGGDINVESGGAINISTGGEITGERIERKIVVVSVPSATAGATAQILDRVMAPGLGVEIKRVALMPNGTCAGHATNNFSLILRNVGTGATESTDIATLALTTGNALSANVQKAFTVATANDDVTALQNLVYAIATAGTGIDFPPGKLVVEFVIDPS